MRYMLLITHNEATSAQLLKESGHDVFNAMQKYTHDLVAAGVLLAGEPLAPSAKGSRVVVTDGKRHVTDGPFSEAKEVIGGFFVIQVKSKEEAIEWAARCPAAHLRGNLVEVREVEDIPHAGNVGEVAPSAGR